MIRPALAVAVVFVLATACTPTSQGLDAVAVIRAQVQRIEVEQAATGDSLHCPRPAREPVKVAPGGPGTTTVALTFDDGPGPATPFILAVLRREHVRATFFDTGLHDREYPALARAVIRDGDVLGNHTFHHLGNWGIAAHWRYARERSEVALTTQVQHQITGGYPCVMRPPGGAFDARALRLVRSMGMSMVLWSTDSRDWQSPPHLSVAFQNEIVRNAVSGLRLAHPIILMHAAKASHERDCHLVCRHGQVTAFRANTVAALPRIIAAYRHAGYTFVTL